MSLHKRRDRDNGRTSPPRLELPVYSVGPDAPFIIFAAHIFVHPFFLRGLTKLFPYKKRLEPRIFNRKPVLLFCEVRREKWIPAAKNARNQHFRTLFGNYAATIALFTPTSHGLSLRRAIVGVWELTSTALGRKLARP